jgi:CubicO group peptidase (beta-lactamase class C family)
MDDLRDAVDDLARATGFAGIVGTATGAPTDFAAAYGLADRAAGVPFAVDTRCAIASGTKGFTALTVMRLVESGLLDLHTTARSVLGPDLPLVDDRVTVEHLLAHRSGIGDFLDEEQGETEDYVLTVPLHTLDHLEAWIPVLDGHPTVSAPDERFAYNNGGYVLLALIAERVSNVPFPALVDELVLMPAGITATGFPRSDTPESGLAVGYVDELAPDRTNVLHLPVVGGGDGGLATTLADVEQLWRAVFAGEICAEATVAAMTRSHSETDYEDRRYGLGFWLPATGGVMLEGCDVGISFRSTHYPAAGTTWTVMGNSTDGAFPIAKLLAQVFGPEGRP